MGRVAAKAGCIYPVEGEGFREGDEIRLAFSDDQSLTFLLPVSVEQGRGEVTLPEGMRSGTYQVSLLRGDRVQYLGEASFVVVAAMPKPMEVIAHRGCWKATGVPQNSRASLRASMGEGCYGSETDIWLTTDGKLVVNHDAKRDGLTLQDATYSQCSMMKLSNGESLPVLSDFLQILKDSDSKTKLIIEIKKHSTVARNQAASQAAVKEVLSYGVADRVEFISFSLDACKEVHALQPSWRVAYLGGDKAPADIAALGLTGIDYQLSVMRKHPVWYREAREKKLSVNVWTVNNSNDMDEATEAGADFVTTDTPEYAAKLKAYYDYNVSR